MWARYTATSFEDNQGRQSCSNPHEKLVIKAGDKYVSFESFFKCVRPALPEKAGDEDIMAILRRAHAVVMLEQGILWRLASRDKNDVEFIPWPDVKKPDIFKPEIRDLYTRFRKQGEKFPLANFPANFEEDFVWSKELLKQLMNGGALPRRTLTMAGDTLFGEKETRYKYPELMPASDLTSKVKKEKARAFFKSLKALEGSTPMSIDLGSSPENTPQKKKTKSSSSFLDESVIAEQVPPFPLGGPSSSSTPNPAPTPLSPVPMNPDDILLGLEEHDDVMCYAGFDEP